MMLFNEDSESVYPYGQDYEMTTKHLILKAD